MFFSWKQGVICAGLLVLGGCDLDQEINGAGSSGNVAPVAFVGEDINVLEGELVSLKGSGSDDDGVISRLFWAQESGPTVVLSGTESGTASFTAPDIHAGETATLGFRLTVTDDDLDTGSAVVKVYVSATLQPPFNPAAHSRDREIYVAWDDSEAKSYNLYYAKESFSSLNSLDNYASLSGGTLVQNISVPHHRIEGLENGVTYFAVVVGINGSDVSNPSNEVSAKAVQSSPAISSLNDTGITGAGHFEKDNYTHCDNEMGYQQDCGHGRDALAKAGKLTKKGLGRQGFDFSRLNSDGTVYSGNGDYRTDPWACVRDNVTGLVWEGKAISDTSPHYTNTTYRWGGLTANGQDNGNHQGEYFDDWNSLVNFSRNETLCGRTNWRLPTISELEGLLDLSLVGNAQMDYTIFPGFYDATSYWSSSPVANDIKKAWSFKFFKGGGREASLRESTDKHVRLVSDK